jgi:hypothetical protein
VSLAFAKDVGAPFLASFARSGDFDEDAPLRRRLPLELGLEDFFLIAMMKARWLAFIDGIAGVGERARAARLAHRRNRDELGRRRFLSLDFKDHAATVAIARARIASGARCPVEISVAVEDRCCPRNSSVIPTGEGVQDSLMPATVRSW